MWSPRRSCSWFPRRLSGTRGLRLAGCLKPLGLANAIQSFHPAFSSGLSMTTSRPSRGPHPRKALVRDTSIDFLQLRLRSNHAILLLCIVVLNPCTLHIVAPRFPEATGRIKSGDPVRVHQTFVTGQHLELSALQLACVFRQVTEFIGRRVIIFAKRAEAPARSSIN